MSSYLDELKRNATRINENRGDSNDYHYLEIKDDEDEQMYSIVFEKSGEANFFINSSELPNNLDLRVYKPNGRRVTSSIRSCRGSKEQSDDIITGLEVHAGEIYYIKISRGRTPSGGSSRINPKVHYKLRVKNYKEYTPIEKNEKLEIVSVIPSKKLIINKKIEFTVRVINTGSKTSEKYKLKIYEGRRLIKTINRYDLNPYSEGSASNIRFYMNKSRAAKYDFTFKVVGESEDEMEKTFTWEKPDFDLSFASIKAKTSRPIEAGEGSIFNVEIENNGDDTSPDVKIKVTDIGTPKYTPVICESDEFHVRNSKDRDLLVDTWTTGNRRLKFELIDVNTNRVLDEEIVYHEWVNEVPDDFASRVAQTVRRKFDNEDFNKAVMIALNEGNKDHPDVIKAFAAVRKEVARECGGSPDNVVVGVIFELEGSYVVGGKGGAGVYQDGSNKTIIGEHFTAGIVFGKTLINKMPMISCGIKMLVFPWAKNYNDISGVGVELGGSFGPLGISISNFAKESVCISFDLADTDTPLGSICPSVSFQFGGMKEKQISGFVKDDRDELIHRLERETR